MAGEKKPNLSRFWLKLIIVYLALIACWPFLRPSYDLLLGKMTAVFIPVFSQEETTVRKVALEDKLNFYLLVRRGEYLKAYTYQLDATHHGYGHIIFTALAVAIPGWTWRKRFIRWIIGIAVLQMSFVLILVVNLFVAAGVYGHEAETGNLLTRLFPAEGYLQCQDLLALVGAQFVPIIVWLALFVFAQKKSPFSLRFSTTG